MNKLRLILLFILLLIIWGSFFTLLALKTDELTKDPCTLCAKKLGENVMCWSLDTRQPITEIFEANAIT